MRNLLVVLLLSSSILGMDIYEYKKQQKSRDRDISLKVVANSKKSITIIFIKEIEDTDLLEAIYPIKLQKCIIKKICIFDIVDLTIDSTLLIQEIKKHSSSNIKSIQPSRQYNFRQL